MKKLKNISLIVMSIALLGLWSCNQTQPIETTSNESMTFTTELADIPETDTVATYDYEIENEGEYNEFVAVNKPWTSRTMAP